MPIIQPKYNPKSQPMGHQAKWLKETWNDEYHAAFWEMGTGKTWFAIMTAAMLYLNDKIDAVLITAPKGVTPVWVTEEIEKHLPANIDRLVALWDSSPNVATKRQIEKLFKPFDGLKIFITNGEAFATQKGMNFFNEYLKVHEVLWVVDESTIIKSPTAKRAKSIVDEAHRAKYRRILTGMPVTQSPLDVFMQCEFLKYGVLGSKNFFSFRHRYAVLQKHNFGGRAVKLVVGFKNITELSDKLKPFSSRVRKKDIKDIPRRYVTRFVEMTKEQKQHYLEMKHYCYTEFEDLIVTSDTAISLILRLHQITCGHLPDTENHSTIALPNNRLSELMSFLEETDEKVIIWASYRHDIKAIYAALVKEYGQDKVVHYFGDTTTEERGEALKGFQYGDVKYLVGNPTVGGKGTTMTAARIMVYFSSRYNLEDRIQSEERIDRISQMADDLLIVDLICKDTVDVAIVKSLRKKLTVSDMMMQEDPRKWLI
jgi:SNF2 family DNA or RNA helicase